MNKYIVNYESGSKSISVYVVSKLSIVQLKEIIESRYHKMLEFKLLDGDDSYILIKTDKIVFINDVA